MKIERVIFNWTCDIYLNVYVYDEFWAARNVKKVMFWIFQAQPASVRVISSIFLLMYRDLLVSEYIATSGGGVKSPGTYNHNKKSFSIELMLSQRPT